MQENNTTLWVHAFQFFPDINFAHKITKLVSATYKPVLFNGLKKNYDIPEILNDIVGTLSQTTWVCLPLILCK